MSFERRLGSLIRMRAQPDQFLGHPFWWSACFLLILNDHVLKGSGVAPALTGKLSDVAGLVAAPAAIAVALRARTTFGLLCVHVSLGMLFVGIKTSPLLARTWEQVGLFCGLHWKVWCDPWDLLALPMLWISWKMTAGISTGSPARGWGRLARGLGCTVGVLSCLATAAPPPRAPRLMSHYVVLESDDEVAVLDREDGKLRFAAESDYVQAALLDSMIVTSSNDAVRGQRVDESGAVAWVREIEDSSSLTTCGESVVVTSEDQTVRLDVATGQELWSVEEEWRKVACWGRILLREEVVERRVFSGSRTDLVGHDLATMRELWRFADPGSVRYLPVSDEFVLAADSYFARALSLHRGTPAWTYRPTLAGWSEWASTDGVVMAAAGECCAVAALNSSGRELWRGPSRHLLGAGGGHFFFEDKGTLLALSADAGKLAWKRDGAFSAFSYVDADADLVIVRDGYRASVTALDAATGQERWTWTKQ